jgi:signal peptidase I
VTPPKRGDIVIFKSPKNKDIDYIKRVIGLPGEHVRLSSSTVYINGKALSEPYLPPRTVTAPGAFLGENKEITVQTGDYFVCGDNRPHSSDSRDFGPIPVGDFIGKGIFRYWPFDKFTIIPQPAFGV